MNGSANETASVSHTFHRDPPIAQRFSTSLQEFKNAAVRKLAGKRADKFYSFLLGVETIFQQWLEKEFSRSFWQGCGIMRAENVKENCIDWLKKERKATT